MLFEITSATLEPQRLIDHVRKDESGAVALFSGVGRNENLGRRVLYLEYDAYPDMAGRGMREIAGEGLGEGAVTGGGVEDRAGRLEVGEGTLRVGGSGP